MDKLKMHSPDITQQNIDKLLELFPHCQTEKRNDEGGVEIGIDFDLLKQALSKNIVEGPKERYQLNWPGKKQALLTANAPINKTLRPCREESVDFDATQNLFIEGDNLEALKLLQETYLGKVKMIYIDPPYNTGKDFIYKDNFAASTDEYLQESGQKDDQGNKLVADTDTKGRYHSDWLSMMYSRLKLARNLLRDDGVMVISISDHEKSNLKKICDEIFGEDNFISCVMWNSTKSVTNTAIISVGHTYNLIYARCKDYFKKNRHHFRLLEDGYGFSNPDNDPRGPWKADPFQVGGWRPNQQYKITNPATGKTYIPNEGNSWKNDYIKFKELVDDKRIVFGSTGEAGPQRKRFLSEAESRGKVTKTWWDDIGTTTSGTQSIKELFDEKSVFSNPKPVDLIQRFIELGDHTNEGIILDFFAGSSTIGHSVFKLNADKKSSKRKLILVQIPENIDENDKDNTQAVEFCKKQNIPLKVSEISKERIRRAGTKIKQDNPKATQLDIGFRVLKIDSSNMNQVYYTPYGLNKEDIVNQINHIKTDRTSEDLLFQVMLDWGVDLSNPIRCETIQGKTVYFVNESSDGPCDLMACFDKGIDEPLIKALANFTPLRMVFRDDGFGAGSDSDSVKINAEQIFKQLAPNTEVKAL